MRSDYPKDASGSPGFDGATIQWLESLEAFQEFVREPKYAERIRPDERTFLDRDSLRLFFSENDDVKIEGNRGNAGVKLLALLKRKPGVTPAEFHRYWAGPHASLFADTPEIARHILAYHQNHRLEKDYRRDAQGVAGFDGLAEQWYTDLSAFQQMFAESLYREKVPADEERFVDRPAIEFMLSQPPDVIIG